MKKLRPAILLLPVLLSIGLSQTASPPSKGEPTNAAEAAAQKAKAEAEIEAKYQAHVAKLPPEQQAWERVLQAQLGGFYLPLHKRAKIAGQSTAWDFVADNPKLPRVLLIGDSVSRGYTQATRKALAGRIGENLSLRRFVRVEAKGRLATYVHGGSKIGVLVDVVGGDEALAKDLAMHIAASKPRALDASGVPESVIEAERRIATEKAAEDAAKSGKQIPPDILAKRVEGSVQKVLKELTLLGQPFVKNDKQTIDQLLKSSKSSVASFTLYVVGEGMEKKKDDFASEVAAAVAAAKQ